MFMLQIGIMVSYHWGKQYRKLYMSTHRRHKALLSYEPLWRWGREAIKGYTHSEVLSFHAEIYAAVLLLLGATDYSFLLLEMELYFCVVYTGTTAGIVVLSWNTMSNKHYLFILLVFLNFVTVFVRMNRSPVVATVNLYIIGTNSEVESAFKFKIAFKIV